MTNRRMLRLFSLWAIFGILLLSAESLSASPRQSPWENFANGFIETYFTFHPPFAAQAGRHEFDGGIPDWSPTGLNKQQQWLESEKAKATGYETDRLSDSERFERLYLIAVIKQDLFWLQTAQSPYKNPIYYSEALDPNLYVSLTVRSCRTTAARFRQIRTEHTKSRYADSQQSSSTTPTFLCRCRQNLV